MIMWSLHKKTPVGSRSLPSKAVLLARHGFTLVEVAIALGIFSFCIISVLGLMQVALASSQDSQNDFAMSNLINNLSATVGSHAAGEISLLAEHSQSKDFDFSGMPIGDNNPEKTHFRATTSMVDSDTVNKAFSLPEGDHLQIWSVLIEYPFPSKSRKMHFLLGSRN
jgi:uncharacterized protein (TIGR02598 family)